MLPEADEDLMEPAPSAPRPRTVAEIDLSVPPEREGPRPPGGFGELFAPLAALDVRTKPSYTDCWITGSPDLRDPVSYNTDAGSVSVGLADNGETMYCLTPREYAYPDRMNALVMDMIDDIRDAYRRDGGSLDRDSVMGMTRAVLTERWDDLREASGSDDADAVVRDVCAIVYRHSVGPGIFDAILADPHIEDVYVDAPCWTNRIHVTLNGIEGLNSHIRCTTNLMAEAREIDALVNILKRQSGLRFSRSSPVLETDMSGYDARATVIGYPLSPLGTAVAIRKHSVKPWTLPRLIAAGSISVRAAGILSFLVNSRAAILVCGARGAGKTSFLASLCTEFPLSQRILTIEDTLELPGDCLRATGYKVQTMLVDERIQGTATTRADDALRVSLRLGESAIVMGEVRGDEARTLYQSMRTGRAGSSIMGTVHGDSADSVYKRMVFDMGIPPEAFMATDAVVSLGTVRDRRSGNLVRRMEEFVATGKEPGTFIDISTPDGLFSAPFMERALRSRQMDRKEVSKDIRARAAMRAYLADIGSRDERFLDLEWVLAANEVLDGMPRGYTADQALEALKERTGQ